MISICKRFNANYLFVVTAAALFTPGTVFAQGAGLEEIIVTAQRREQTLQEVPISIDVITGDAIDLQGYRNLDDLSKYNPSVNIEAGTQEQDVTIRGFGTSGNSRTLLSATPVFLDGIYFGRTSQIKTAFMDAERVEILKGPQPLFFGLNATAGAFNITSRKPTPEWQGDVSFEVGNDGKNELFGAIGGPVTDELGIRVAALRERNDGPVRNNVDPEQKVSHYDNTAGRITINWTPTENLTILGKVEGSKQRNGSELRMGCLTEGPASGYTSRDGPFQSGTDDTAIGQFGYGDGVLAPAEEGGIPYNLAPIQKARRATGEDCFKDEFAFNVEGPYPTKSSNITGEAARDVRGGSIDYLAAADAFWSRDGVVPQGEMGFWQFWGFDANGSRGEEQIDSVNALLDINYVLNGFTINSLTGWTDFDKFDKRDNSDSPFFQNFQVQAEYIALWSEQIRIQSPRYDLNMGGGSSIEFMIGGLVQDLDINTHSYYPKDNVRRGLRTNVTYEDARWYSGFWNVNLNFMDDQLSLQIGGRYTEVEKESFVMGTGQQWIFEGRPCDSAGTDANPATCALDPDFKQINPNLTQYTTYDAINDVDSRSGRPVRIDSPILLLDGLDTGNLWTAASWQTTRDIPLNYRAPNAVAVGLTAPVIGVDGVVRQGPWGNCSLCLEDLNAKASDYDGQYVLSFTPNRLNGRHTFYGKFAEAFKGPATDLAAGPIPSNPDDITFAPEFSETWELGAKGTLWDSRVRYDVAAFITTFTDLQTAAAAPPFNPLQQASVSLNAGEQEVKGIEFNIRAAVTDGLVLNFAGALMDGEMVDFDGGGCTNSETIAASIRALANPADYSPAALDEAEGFLSTLGGVRRALLPSASELPGEFFINGGCRLEEVTNPDGTVSEAGTINRSGEVSARTPEWSLVVGLDYEHSLFNDYIYFINVQGFRSDGYITEETTFQREIKYNAHGDINLAIGVGPQDGSWRVIGYARNILESTKSYNPEYDLEFSGIISTENVSPANFLQYGVRFAYNFN